MSENESLTDEQLRQFLAETCSDEESASIEKLLETDEQLADRLDALASPFCHSSLPAELPPHIVAQIERAARMKTYALQCDGDNVRLFDPSNRSLLVDGVIETSSSADAESTGIKLAGVPLPDGTGFLQVVRCPPLSAVEFSQAAVRKKPVARDETKHFPTRIAARAKADAPKTSVDDSTSELSSTDAPTIHVESESKHVEFEVQNSDSPTAVVLEVQEDSSNAVVRQLLMVDPESGFVRVARKDLPKGVLRCCLRPPVAADVDWLSAADIDDIFAAVPPTMVPATIYDHVLSINPRTTREQAAMLDNDAILFLSIEEVHHVS